MTYLNEVLVSVGVGLVAGVVSSMASHLLLSLTKPRIKLSDKISKKVTQEGIEYRVKVVNLSRHYAKNVKVILELVTRQVGMGGQILKVEPIPLARPDVNFIEPYNKKDRDALYAVRFQISSPLENVWQDDENTFLLLTLYCESEFNGAGKVFSQEYAFRRNSIKEGDFRFGKSCEIE